MTDVHASWVIGDLVKRTAFNLPNKIAVISGDTRLTYRELDAQSNAFGNAMLDLGVKPADRVAVLSRNSLEFIIIHYGLAKIGAVMVPLNFRYTERELTFVVNDSGAKMLIFQGEFADLISACQPKLPGVLHYASIGNVGEGMNDYYRLVEKYPTTPPKVAVKEEDECTLLYTAGTTGSPKGAIISHKASVATSISVSIDLCIQEDDIALISAPLFHAGQINLSLHPMASVGGTLVLLAKFDPDEALHLIGKEKITRIGMVPTMLYQLIESPKFKDTDINSIRRVNYGASPIPRNGLRMTLESFKDIEITQSYGTSECGQLTVLKPQDQLRKFGCTGKAMTFVDLRIFDANSQDVPPGEIGEIVTRGPHVMSGYLKRAEETEEAFKKGWYHTGDMATSDDEGFITIVDRKRDMIISGGENIYPKEIEDVLGSHPAVLEVAVFGIPDEKWVESVCAAIVLKSGMKASEAEIIDYCKKNLASYKKPKVVTFVDSLPKNELGKTLKKVLKAPYWKNYARKI